MMPPMTDHTQLIIHEPALKILDYAERAGVDHRTVREWLRKGLLPDAYKDGRGRWWIPASARKMDVPVAPRVDSSPAPSREVDLIMTTDAPPAPTFIPLYMPLEAAAPLLGVTAYQIAQHPDEFDVRPWGANGALVVPVRRLLGLTS